MKPIKIDKNTKEELLKKFLKQLEAAKLSDGKFTFSESFKTIEAEAIKPTIAITPAAYLKMMKLVASTDTEIAWHGLVQRTENRFLIYDILLYPQTVAGATVNTDQQKYNTWLMDQPDEIFNFVRMQGHSHVSMGVSPSAQDNLLYDKILQVLPENDYYIFMILNKRMETHIILYDLLQNALYENKEINFQIELSAEETMDAWYSEGYKKYIEKAVSEFSKTVTSPGGVWHDKPNHSWEDTYYDREGYTTNRDNYTLNTYKDKKNDTITEIKSNGKEKKKGSIRDATIWKGEA